MCSRPVVFRSLVLAVLAGAATVAFVLPAQDAAQDAAEERGAMSPEAVVAAMAGTWDLSLKGMGAEPSPGTSVVRLVGDRWAVEDVESSMMGQAFVGHGIAGFDAELGKFVGYWVDNMTPKVSRSTSTWDEASRTLVSDPTEEDGPTGKIKVIGRFRLVDEDHWVYSQALAEDQATVLWSVEYARRK